MQIGLHGRPTKRTPSNYINMIRYPLNYTVYSPKHLKDVDLGQFTLNPRMFPSKRNYPRIFKELNIDKPFIVHCDFTYIASRFAFLAKHVKEAVIEEIASLNNYNKETGLILGMVHHMDAPLRQVVIKHPQRLAEFYDKPLFNFSYIRESMDKTPTEIMDYTVRDFYNHLKPLGMTFPIFLENTTKPLGPVAGSAEWLIKYLNDNSDLHDIFGMVLDMEHAYALTGYNDIENFLNESFKKMVHINSIPERVKPFSRIDDHSKNTIFECSVHSPEYYLELFTKLTDMNIPYVREVVDITRERELKQINEYLEIYYHFKNDICPNN